MDYPEVPPGCRYFNPRRLRRHARKLREYAIRREQEAQLLALRQQHRANRRAQLEAEKESQQGVATKLANKVKGFTQKLFGRKTG